MYRGTHRLQRRRPWLRATGLTVATLATAAALSAAPITTASADTCVGYPPPSGTCVGGVPNTPPPPDGAAVVETQVTQYTLDGVYLGTGPVTVSAPEPISADTGDLQNLPNAQPQYDALDGLSGCAPGKVCGNPSYSGCANATVKITQYTATGSTHWVYQVDKYFCWTNRQITYGPYVSSYIHNADATVVDHGNISDSEYFYYYWSGVPNSGHATKVQRYLQYCVPYQGNCYDNKYPWIHVYVHGDGTIYFHAGE